jgi:FtsP/CotA-like multicopper oxidase with cupredoxin domain
MDKMPEALQEEERVGLLDEEDGNELKSLISEDEELEWSDKDQPTHHCRRRRKWPRIFVVLFFGACTLGFIVHSFFTSRRDSPPSFATSQLRPEEDYILDPTWDFNAAQTTREYHWTIAEHELNPDGVYRSMTLLNGMFPGPLIECNEGDELVIHVENQASNATSIHWHGLYQNGTNWMDGTVGITQCPIAPGRSFTYRFNVSGQTGTYWYHSHMAMQASDGLVGPIVIHAKGNEEKDLQKVPYGEDRVVLVSDHYYDLSSSLLMQYLAPGSENDEPVPKSALINGRAMRDCAEVPNRHCSSASSSNAMFDLSVEHNTRLRIINVGAFAEFQIQIDEHEFQLTEVDGVDVHPESIHRLNINPAQRYSIILIPPTPNKGLYWMRARMITHCFAYEEPELKEEVRGVIRYETAEQSIEPSSRDWPEIIEVECRDLNISTLSPVKVVAAPAEADDKIYLRSSFQIRDWRLSRGYLNDSSYRANISHPTLNDLVSGYTQQKQPYMSSLSLGTGINTELFDPKHALVYQTTGIRTIDILIQNFDDGNHPFHLHGHTFFVLAAGHGYPPENLYQKLNLTNPLRRDTASVEAYGWTLIRFVADNPGVWAFHCHIGWHNEAGLLMQFLTRADEVAMWTLPADVEGLCAADGIEKGAGPNDAIWFGSWD